MGQRGETCGFLLWYANFLTVAKLPVKICYSVLVGIFLGDCDYLVSLLVSHEHYVGFVHVLENLGKYLNSSLTFSKTGKS